MRVNVKNYMYRWFDNMLILQTEDDNVLYIYCPSGAYIMMGFHVIIVTKKIFKQESCWKLIM